MMLIGKRILIGLCLILCTRQGVSAETLLDELSSEVQVALTKVPQSTEPQVRLSHLLLLVPFCLFACACTAGKDQSSFFKYFLVSVYEMPSAFNFGKRKEPEAIYGASRHNFRTQLTSCQSGLGSDVARSPMKTTRSDHCRSQQPVVHDQIADEQSPTRRFTSNLYRKPKFRKIQQLSGSDASNPDLKQFPCELCNFALDASDDDDDDVNNWEMQWWENEPRSSPCSTPINGPDAGCSPLRTLVLPPPAVQYKDYGICGRQLLRIEAGLLVKVTPKAVHVRNTVHKRDKFKKKKNKKNASDTLSSGSLTSPSESDLSLSESDSSS